MNLPLKTAFDRESIDPRCYSFTGDGIGEVYRIQAKRDPTGIMWSVYYAERGLRSGEVVFRSEAEACALIYEQVMSDPNTRK